MGNVQKIETDPVRVIDIREICRESVTSSENQSPYGLYIHFVNLTTVPFGHCGL